MADWDIGAVSPVSGVRAGQIESTDKVLISRAQRLMLADAPDLEASGISLLSFNAKAADGVTDASDALDEALAYCVANGVPLILPAGTICISRTFNIGDGTNTRRSTYCGVRIITAAGGVSQGEFGTPRQGTRLKWIGATGTWNPSAATDLVDFAATFVVMCRVNGPIHSLTMDPIVFDCDSKADVGIEYVHPYMSVFDRPVATNYRTIGIRFRSILGPIAGLSVTQGAFKNVFIAAEAYTPSRNTAAGLVMFGGETNNVGCSINQFIGGSFQRGGAVATGHGIIKAFTDQNVFLNTFTPAPPGGYSDTGAFGVFGIQSGDTVFPWGNAFYDCPLSGGVGGTWGREGNSAIPWPNLDNEGDPPLNWFATLHNGTIRQTGRFPYRFMRLSGAPANQGMWREEVTSAAYVLGLFNDAGAFQQNAIQFNRTLGNLDSTFLFGDTVRSVEGPVIDRPVIGQTYALGNNGEIVIEFTNNTTLTVKGRGSDGTTRSATITLA